MRTENLKIKWSKRLPADKLRRLYISQAKGLLDEELLEDVAATLYLRCKDIIAVNRARYGEVRCPFCYGKDRSEVFIKVQTDETTGKYTDNLKCPECGEEFSFAEFRKSHKRKQLNLGGAGEAFRRYAGEYEIPAEPEIRMLQIDRLIHEFHYSLKSKPDYPTRSVGPNLLAAKLTDAMKFLNELSGIVEDNPDLKNSANEWQEKKRKWTEIYTSWKEQE